MSEQPKRYSLPLGAEHYRQMIESATDMAIIALDLDRKIISWNPGAERLIGYTEDEALGRSGDLIFTEEDCARDEPSRECKEAVREGRSVDERWHLRKDKSRFWGSGLMMPLRDEYGQVVGLMKMFRDRTRQHQQEATNKLLQGELNHRVKNILTIVHALARSLMRTSPSVRDFEKAFGSRLQALARAHDLVSHGDWRSVGLADVLGRTLEPYSNPVGRVSINGPLVVLSSDAAIALHMAFHELATNAVKYGSLTSDKGRVLITWELKERAQATWVELHWREQDGPPVKEPQTRGFGSQLIDQSVQQIGGVSNFDYLPDGLVCGLRFPLTRPDDEDKRLN